MSTNEVLRALTKPVKGKRGRMPTKNRTEWGWKYPDGREVCDGSERGRILYYARTLVMAERQSWLCCFCGQFMRDEDVTFEHENGRGAGKRDDRIRNASITPSLIEWRKLDNENTWIYRWNGAVPSTLVTDKANALISLPHRD